MSKYSSKKADQSGNTQNIKGKSRTPIAKLPEIINVFDQSVRRQNISVFRPLKLSTDEEKGLKPSNSRGGNLTSSFVPPFKRPIKMVIEGAGSRYNNRGDKFRGVELILKENSIMKETSTECSVAGL